MPSLESLTGRQPPRPAGQPAATPAPALKPAAPAPATKSQGATPARQSAAGKLDAQLLIHDGLTSTRLVVGTVSAARSTPNAARY